MVPESWDDDELFAELRHAIDARRAVPPEFVEAGKSAFAWHNIAAELAQLTYDSAHHPELAAGTRAEAASIRGLTFTSARLTIELEVSEDALLGQVVPAQAVTIEVQAREDGRTGLDSDEIGCFTVQPIPPGPFRLLLRTAGGADVLTGWIVL